MTTGEKIKALRLEKGMTQEELGDKLGVKKAAVHKWETGLVVNIKRSTIARLCDVLGTNPFYLMGYDEQSDEELALTEDERQFILMIRKLTPQGREAARQMLQSLQALQAQLSADQ